MMRRNSQQEIRSSPRLSNFLLRIAAILLVLAGFIAGCRSPQQPASADFFPPSDSVPHWMKSSATAVYQPDDLWKYIDGDAERYRQAGVVRVFTTTYRFNLVSDASADVYVMGSSASAQKVYDSQSAGGGQALPIGDAGAYTRGLLTFHQGPYFVRLVAYDDSPEMAKALTDLARAISSRLNASSAGR